MDEKILLKQWAKQSSSYCCFAKKNYGKIGDEDYVQDICWSRIKKWSANKVSIKIIKKRIKHNSNQFVLLNDDQVKEYLKLIKRYFGGIDKILISKHEIIINLDFTTLKAGNSTENKLLIYTLTRYLHEKQFNIMLYAAFKVKSKHPKYRLFDLLLWAHTKSVINKSFNTGHALLYPVYYCESIRNTRDLFLRFDHKAFVTRNYIGPAISSRVMTCKKITNEKYINEIKTIFNESISNWEL